MNIIKRIYCRTFQKILKISIPLLPYREPKILKTNGEIVAVFKEQKISCVMIVTDNTIYNLNLTNSLQNELENNNIKTVVFKDVQANPTTNNVEEAFKIYIENKCNALIGFGGGSSIDCAKAIGVRVARPKAKLSKLKGILKVWKKLPMLIAIPTTAGTGSETTLASVIVDSETRHKYAINDFPLIPKYAMLDANLLVGLPKNITATTGMDALTHAVEAYIGKSTTKSTRKNAKEAVKLIFENLENSYLDPTNLEYRNNMLKASYMAGLAFTKSYVGYIHAIAHSLGGKYNTAHGLANAVIMPYVLKKYGKSVFKKLWQLGIYANLFDTNTSYELGAKLFIEKIEQMNINMNIPTSMKEIKLDDILTLAKIAEKEANPLYPVPKLFTASQLAEIYKEVLNG